MWSGFRIGRRGGEGQQILQPTALRTSMGREEVLWTRVAEAVEMAERVRDFSGPSDGRGGGTGARPPRGAAAGGGAGESAARRHPGGASGHRGAWWVRRSLRGKLLHYCRR
jgi:hypothetical protein